MKQTLTVLTATEYIDWSRKSEWSDTEAAYLLDGKRPPSSQLDTSAIEDLFPYLKAVFGQARHYPAREAQFPQNLIHLALDLNLQADALKNWEAIFPFARSQSMNSILERKPDYRDFSYAYLRNNEAELGELARFARNLSRDDVQQEVDSSGSRFEIKEYRNVLRDMARQFQREGLSRDDLEAAPINVRAFVKRYPRKHFEIDARCDRWVGWVQANPELATLIQTPSSDADHSIIGAKSISSILKEEGTRAALAILRNAYRTEQSLSRKELKTLLQKSKVADEISGDPADYPACNAYMKQVSWRRDRRDFADRLPDLAKVWKAFADDDVILTELKRLESRE